MPKRSEKITLINNLTTQSRNSLEEHRYQTDQVSQTSHSEDSFQENNQVSTRPTRAAKVRCLQYMTDITRADRSYDLEVLRERAAQRIANESNEQRERRLQDLRQRAAQRIATENDEQRERRLQALRQRAAQRMAIENERLEEQRRRRALELNNYLPTYKCAVTEAVQYHALEPKTEQSSVIQLEVKRKRLKPGATPHFNLNSDNNLTMTMLAEQDKPRDTDEPNVPQTLCKPEGTTARQNQDSPTANIPAGCDTPVSKVDGTSTPIYSEKTPQVLRDPLQEFANDSEEPNIKEEVPDDADCSNYCETEEFFDKEAVFIKSLRYEDEDQSEDHSKKKRARLDTSVVSHEYAEQMYEFGKYVAEQLLCLDVAEARVVQKEIRDLLLKHCENVSVTDSSVQPATDWHCDKVGQARNSVTSSVKSGSKVSADRTYQIVPEVPVVARSYLKVYSRRPPSNSKVTIRPQLPQSVSKVNIIRPSMTQTILKVNTIRPSMSQSGSVHVASSKKYVNLPQVTALDVTQMPVEHTATTTQAETLHVKSQDIAGSTELDTCSENISEVKVKTEPECESDPSIVNDTRLSAGDSVICIKFEPDTDIDIEY